MSSRGLDIGAWAGYPLADPFSILRADECSGQTLAPTASCSFTARFAPASIDAFNDSFDIPSNDPDEPSVTVALNGNGVEAPVDNAESGPSGAKSGFMAIDQRRCWPWYCSASCAILRMRPSR